MDHLTTTKIQTYQQGELIDAKGLLARALGILDARSGRDDILPMESELRDMIRTFQARSLFPKKG